MKTVYSFVAEGKILSSIDSELDAPLPCKYSRLIFAYYPLTRIKRFVLLIDTMGRLIGRPTFFFAAHAFKFRGWQSLTDCRTTVCISVHYGLLAIPQPISTHAVVGSVAKNCVQYVAFTSKDCSKARDAMVAVTVTTKELQALFSHSRD